MRSIALIILVTLLTGCGYQFGQGCLPSKYSTITIPFVDGDQYGELTASLTKEISRSGSFTYRRECADLILCVKIVDYSYENIGYRYDRDKDHELEHSIIPTETRARVIAEVTVIEACSGCILLGPAQIRAWLDFDHDYYDSRNGINVFSMGQVTDYDAATDNVYKPLYNVLSRKIVDYINDAW